VALSGGGFRATLAGVGVIRFLADAGLLAKLRYASSVSGGSVANGVLARRWGELRAAGYSPVAVDDLIVDPILNAVTGSSMKNELLRNLWRAVGAKTPHGRPCPGPRPPLLRWRPPRGPRPRVPVVFNAANLTLPTLCSMCSKSRGMTAVLIYTRLSTEDVHDATVCQEVACRSYAVARNWEVAATLSDASTYQPRERRPGFETLRDPLADRLDRLVVKPVIKPGLRVFDVRRLQCEWRTPA
jgi:hypothetical protein